MRSRLLRKVKQKFSPRFSKEVVIKYKWWVSRLRGGDQTLLECPV
jgi:hypothetical protein